MRQRECIGGPWDGRTVPTALGWGRVKVTWFANAGPREPHLFNTVSSAGPSTDALREGYYRVRGDELVWEGER